jgi:phosphoribosylformimino-5-aminoimidazole carboxamide ribotide isomerase
MDVIPAVDLLGGEAVRLVQGDFDVRAGTNPDPAASVRDWVRSGASWLHFVDLDGARTGTSRNLSVAIDLAREARGVDPTVRVQLGGGLRDPERVDEVLSVGVDIAILGTSLVERPQLMEELADRWPGRIAASIDVRDGAIAVEGWTRLVDADPAVLAGDLVRRGASTVVVTDVRRDGTGRGPNLDLVGRIRDAVPDVRVLAAGGITTVAQLAGLARLGVDGAIVGLALLDGSLRLADAIAAAAAGEVRA